MYKPNIHKIPGVTNLTSSDKLTLNKIEKISSISSIENLDILENNIDILKLLKSIDDKLQIICDKLNL